MLTLMGDFDVKLGCQAKPWGSAYGKFGLLLTIIDMTDRSLPCTWVTASNVQITCDKSTRATITAGQDYCCIYCKTFNIDLK